MNRNQTIALLANDVDVLEAAKPQGSFIVICFFNKPHLAFYDFLFYRYSIFPKAIQKLMT